MKSTILSILISGALIAGAILISGKSSGDTPARVTEEENNVSIVEGQQIISIFAKGGYSPRVTNAKADIPTVLKVETKGTFDCSSAIAIPSIGYRANLPLSGVTEIKLPAQKPGTTLQGFCGMGMYNFSINYN